MRMAIRANYPAVVLGSLLGCFKDIRNVSDLQSRLVGFYLRLHQLFLPLMQGFSIIQSFGEIIQNQLSFGAFGIMESSGDQKNQHFIPKSGLLSRP